MKKLISVLITIVFISANSLAYAQIQTVDNKPDWKAQIFLANQTKGIGLVDSYQEDSSNISYVYDNCLAAIAFMLMGNSGLAKEILDTLCNEVEKNPDGIPFESYQFPDVNGKGSGTAFCGNTAWLLQALNIYQKLNNSKIYFNTQKKLADFLLSLQDSNDGGLWGAKNEYWKSTEHNMIAYVALRNFGRLNRYYRYLSKAERIKKFLKTPAIWDGFRFYAGLNDTTGVTDVQALGVLLLGNDYSNALSWAETNLKLSLPYSSQIVTGFDFGTDRDTVWIEGTIQMALAFYKSNNSSKAEYYFNEVSKTIQSDGSLILATNQGTASHWWIMQPWRAIAPTCWLIFYRLKFNPYILYIR